MKQLRRERISGEGNGGSKCNQHMFCMSKYSQNIEAINTHLEYLLSMRIQEELSWAVQVQ